MNTALITGVTSGIGKAICDMLLDNGFCIYGIGRDFSKIPSICNKENFHPLVCDLSDTKKLSDMIKELAKAVSFTHLIHNAGVGYFGPHEELNPKKIHEMVTVNLEVPMLLNHLLLRHLKKVNGTIIAISSVTAQKSNTHGCAYGATKAGLTNFHTSLFDEIRKYGVRVITIHPDMTQSDFYRNADFMEGETEDTYLYPEEVAAALQLALNQREGMLISELTLKPQRHQIKKKVKN